MAYNVRPDVQSTFLRSEDIMKFQMTVTPHSNSMIEMRYVAHALLEVTNI